MQKFKDWSIARRKEATWKLFYADKKTLNIRLVFLALFPLPAIYIFLNPLLAGGQVNWLIASSILPVLVAFILIIHNLLSIRNGNLPVVALGHKYIAVKQGYFSGYHLLEWTEIDNVHYNEKDASNIFFGNIFFNPKGASKKSEAPISTKSIALCCHLSKQDSAEVLALAKQHITPPPEKVQVDEQLRQTAMASTGAASIVPPQKKRSLFGCLGRLILIIGGIPLAIFLLGMIYYLVFVRSNYATKEDFFTNGHYTIYDRLASAYPDVQSAYVQPVVLNYAFIRHGQEIQKYCPILSQKQNTRFADNTQKAELLFENYLFKKLALPLPEIINRTQLLHKITSQEEGNLSPDDCGEKSERIIDYARRTAREWAQKNKALPYDLKSSAK